MSRTTPHPNSTLGRAKRKQDKKALAKYAAWDRDFREQAALLEQWYQENFH